ncbi:hypothetical protein J3R30DRAFT_3714343 [Lentinula aciculospora]|uniref:protein-histidine N-methyltransferase n=1 Tax=Lentinula aciculospora TaxID=153920 RepID=A0A9W8ZYB8_9AGAR|nr:hypothetical protein J3R30DRAFT_3714343 [Lentinula aciculospora]
MFKFGFALDDEDVDAEIDYILKQAGDKDIRGPSVSKEFKEKSEDVSCVELSIEHLLNSLPTQLSYSPLEIPLSSSPSSPTSASTNESRVHYLSRRDLFDARFQVISEDKDNPDVVENSTKKKNEPIDVSSDPRLQFLDTPSDLVPGVYEGGLKTWECSLDLVDYLDANLDTDDLKGKKVLELGCGTGVPSLYLLQRIFSSPPIESTSEKTVIHFQDYNPSALELVTFPNMLLTWYMSSASQPFLSSQMSHSSSSDFDAPEYPPLDPTIAGDLPVTSSLKNAFQQSLEKYNVQLRFFGGSWKNFKNLIRDSNAQANQSQAQHTFERGLRGYDILLTSETIYRTDSVPELLHAMWEATRPFSSSSSSPSDNFSRLAIFEPNPLLILVAAKVFYFGVGGGLDVFAEAVNKWDGAPGANIQVTTVWEKNVGVGRRIVRVVW